MAVQQKTKVNKKNESETAKNGIQKSEGKNEDHILAFLYASIVDIQNTIKAVDTKIGFLIVAIGIPVGALGKIFNVLNVLHGQANSRLTIILFWVFIAVFSLAWLSSFVAALMALISISNPRTHVKEPPENGGSYFRGGLFDFKFIDTFINRGWFKRNGPMSNCTVDDIIKVLPREKTDIIQELAFEQMKLAYIRDTKIFRQNAAYVSAAIWLSLGFLGWIIKLFLTIK